jgi:Fe-S-cluster-containing dehydrogenase component
MRLAVVNLDRCIGCESCVLACSRTWYHAFSYDLSRIQIRTAGGIEGRYIVAVCRACTDPPCARSCRTGALTPRKGGGVILKPELCDSCGLCQKSCIIQGAVRYDNSGKPLICKHCGICAKYCPHQVIQLEKIKDPENIELEPKEVE